MFKIKGKGKGYGLFDKLKGKERDMVSLIN